MQTGAKVIVLDRHAPPTGIDHLKCDLGDPLSIEEAAAKLPERIFGLCNVAGIPGDQNAELVFRVNFLAPRLLTQLLAPRFIEGGATVNVASAAGARWMDRIELLRTLMQVPDFAGGLKWFSANQPDWPVYNFSKEALIFYTKHATLAARRNGFRINSVSPGPVETPLLPSFERTMGREAIAATGALVGRHGRSEEVADVVVFLLGRLSSWINGTDVAVDGGATAAFAAKPTSLT
jgi:NAD(P)-dependent dehydrogenase (short-subunit alcohol dehydrogenase family)